jgi:hypothetical protein
MARTILAGSAAAWLLAGAAGMALAAFGTEGLERALPPLAIDTEALRGAITAVAAGLIAVGIAHLIVLAGLRSGSRGALSAAILLAGVLAVALVALGVAAVTSAVTTPQNAVALAVAAAATALAAAAYGLVAWLLVSELRARSAS